MYYSTYFYNIKINKFIIKSCIIALIFTILKLISTYFYNTKINKLKIK